MRVRFKAGEHLSADAARGRIRQAVARFTFKGEKRIVLISDACVFDGPIPPGYEGVTDINFDFAGEIAGSKLTLDVACRNMMIHTGCSILDVFRYASTNPAEALGLKRKGEIRVGNDADLVITDNWMNVQNVILKGELTK